MAKSESVFKPGPARRGFGKGVVATIAVEALFVLGPCNDGGEKQDAWTEGDKTEETQTTATTTQDLSLDTSQGQEGGCRVEVVIRPEQSYADLARICMPSLVDNGGQWSETAQELEDEFIAENGRGIRAEDQVVVGLEETGEPAGFGGIELID